MKLSNMKKIRGQGMSEYLILVALIAVACIAAVGFFGVSAGSQVAAIATEIGGGDGGGAQGRAAAAGGEAAQAATTRQTLATYHVGQ